MSKNNNKNKKGVNKNWSNKIIISCFFFALATLSVFNVSFYLNKQPNEVWVQETNFESQIKLWESFLIVHPDYFQGWIELANLEISNGNHQSAKIAFLNAWKINPNSEEINALESKLENIN